MASCPARCSRCGVRSRCRPGSFSARRHGRRRSADWCQFHRSKPTSARAARSLTTTRFLPVGDLASSCTSTRIPGIFTLSNQAIAPSTAAITSGLGRSRLINKRTMPTDSLPLMLTSS